MKKETYVITGAACGIGRALTELLLSKNQHVHALDINEDKLTELEEWARKNDHKVSTRTIDITDCVAVETLIAEMEAREVRISHWVNCAGVSGVGTFESLSAKDYERVLDLNLLSIVRSTRPILKHMQAQGKGKIVNLSSVAGFVPAPLMSAYNLTKHALVGFTRSMQAEMKYLDSPVQFVLVCPGFVETEMIRKGQDMGFPEWLSPLLSTPENVAKEIFQGLKKNKVEIFPTLNGKSMLLMYKHFPSLVTAQARLLTVKNWKDILLNRH
ncbi:MAG TPA: SDR family NAD(P)-dependent oxidoreductase [Bacteriovoracaceae bacterium]|nr:SDR family NAD(P)-dependent oxidoreductase [Bacteriovoracaceae bacterium]